MTSNHGGEISGQKASVLRLITPPACMGIGEARGVFRGLRDLPWAQAEFPILARFQSSNPLSNLMRSLVSVSSLF